MKHRGVVSPKTEGIKSYGRREIRAYHPLEIFAIPI